MKKEIIRLRELMQEEAIDCYVVPTSDEHNSEYVSDYDQIRRWLTGFTGSNGTLVVTNKEAKLWTDGRYFVQCEKELKNTGIKMMKMGEAKTPTVWEYIVSLTNEADSITVGFDGNKLTKSSVDDLLRLNAKKEIKLKYNIDIAGNLWAKNGRGERKFERVKLHDISFAGKSCMEKCDEVREIMKKKDCKQFFLSKLDDIMWLFNLRGSDVECNPVAYSFAFISMNESFIFLNKDAISEALRAYLASQRVIICDYEDVYDFLSDYPYEGKTIIDENEISYNAYMSLLAGNENKSDMIVTCINPTTELKAIKNETEKKWMREYFLRDSVATTKYIYFLKRIAKSLNKEKFTEYDATRKCDELRLNTEGCIGLSFDTIAAYAGNAAMMHYKASKDSMEIKNRGMLLTDCGGQYPGATTDVTRTIAMGEVTDEEKADFTLVLKGWLALMNAQWLEGCTGRNLDILARGPLWNAKKDYKCGTGHGVGCYLSVHEGPQNIRWKYIPNAKEAILQEGMTVTDEPGVYIANKYGIRTENTLLVEDRGSSSDGHFLGFENLTWVPIDIELVNMDLLSKAEIDQLKEYQQKVFDKINEKLNDEEICWLKKQLL